MAHLTFGILFAIHQSAGKTAFNIKIIIIHITLINY